ncbi:MAG: MmcQ/YjbR family DNA-binding protein [Myxococcales bacterium]|nr:MmcQ/YjbR family DNA-binding protein [Myxococcales bacterium]MCB9736993.1 MmcQ/YjbR family DNA-binding protein [Deltaproteobacteria bacterium]
MITLDDYRRIALSLPETEERSHFEQPDFRVKGKIFATMHKDGLTGALKIEPLAQAALVAAHPDALTPASGAWGRSGWTTVTFAAIDADLAERLVRDSWRLVAPKKLAATLPPEG